MTRSTSQPESVAEASEGTLDLDALLAARRWVMVSLSFITMCTLTLSMSRSLDQVPLSQGLMLASALVLMVVGTFLSARDLGLWLLTAAMLGLFLTVLPGVYPWTQFVPLVAIFEAALFAITLSPRAVGLVMMIAASVALIIVPPDQTAVLIVGDSVVTTGMVRALQLVLAGAFLLIAWPGMVERARSTDAHRTEREYELAESLRTQERLHVWRDTAIRVHETILNDIRYVLGVADIDREALASVLGSRPGAGLLEEAQARSLKELVGQAVAESGFAGEVSVDGAPITVEGRLVPYLRSALIEFLRNLSRHSTATTAFFSGALTPEWIQVTCRSDARSPDLRPPSGIGRSIVLDEGISSRGGRVEVRGADLILWLPSSARKAGDVVSDPCWDPGRIAVSGVLAGVAAGAFPYPLELVRFGTPSLTVASVLVLALLAAAVVVALRRPMLSTSAVSVAAILAAAVPLVIWSEQSVCVPADSLAYVVAIAGLALVAVAVWSRWRGGLLLLLPWAVSATLFVLVSPGVACEEVPLVALGASVLVGVFAPIVLDYTLRRSRRIADQARALEEMRVREAAQAEAALDLARTLDVTVTAAWDVMHDIARGADLDESRRAILTRLESRIRATIQVDTRTSGAVTQLAHDLVMSAAADGRSTRVLALRGSRDRRPLPEGIRERLLAFAVTSDAEPSIQAFSVNGIDHLAMTGSGAAAAGAGMPADARWSDGPVDIEVNSDDAEGSMVAVILRRPSID